MSCLPEERSVVWTADDEFTVHGTDYVAVGFGYGPRDKFAVHKPRETVDAFVELVTSRPASRIVELGIRGGGSTALLAQLMLPSKLVAVDIAPEAVTNLEHFLDTHQLRDRVRPYYGVDQADRRRLSAIVTDEFDGGPIDLVIDDASHLLEPTRASFEVLFPELRHDGLFVIEDWSWEHAIASKLYAALGGESPHERLGRHELLRAMATMGLSAEMLAPLRSGEVLSDLVGELIVAKADGDTTIGNLAIRPFWVEIRRGPAVIDANELAAAVVDVAPSRMLYVGQLDDNVRRQVRDAGVLQLVVASPSPPGGDGGGSTITHVPVEPSTALPSQIVDQLGGARFDAVLDGASTDADRARDLASSLLPLVSPAGSYLLRGWPNLIVSRSQAEGAQARQRLPRLLLELILSVAEWNEPVREVTLGEEWLAIRRGARELPTEDFDVTHLYRDHFETLSRC